MNFRRCHWLKRWLFIGEAIILESWWFEDIDHSSDGALSASAERFRCLRADHLTPLYTIFCPVASVLSLSFMFSRSAERVASERHLSEGSVGPLLICHNRTSASTFSTCPAFSRVSSATLACSKLLEVGRFGFVLLLNRR